MGTRSLTVLKRGKEEIAVLYRQFDGYPEGHGRDLAEFLAGKSVVNGISGDATKVFNGPNAVAAQVVANFVDANTTGGFYLYPPGTRDCGEEYVYEVASDYPDGMWSNIRGAVRIKMSGHQSFDGTPEEFLEAFPSREKANS